MNDKILNSVKDFLDEQYLLVNTPAFIHSDPVQFPRRYTQLQDIEIVSLMVATITWGKRSMILKNAERMLEQWGSSPFDFVMNEGYKVLGKANIHRTFFEQDLAYMLRGFRHIFSVYGNVENLVKERKVHLSGAPAWEITRLLLTEMKKANGGIYNRKCLPLNLEQSALKRVNLALRWLVRNDGIVDLGVWKVLLPGQLFIPLDVHVGNVARGLGILQRKSNDRKAVEELTGILREFCPEDPVKYDFALFGMGINARQ